MTGIDLDACHCLERPPNENLSRSESVTRITNYDSYTMGYHIICLDIVKLNIQSLFPSHETVKVKQGEKLSTENISNSNRFFKSTVPQYTGNFYIEII